MTIPQFEIEPHIKIDARGLACPLPLLRLKQQLKQMQPAEYILLIASDPASQHDIPYFCQAQQHHLIQTRATSTAYYFLVQK